MNEQVAFRPIPSLFSQLNGFQKMAIRTSLPCGTVLETHWQKCYFVSVMNPSNE
jgi:hypothetical protein